MTQIKLVMQREIIMAFRNRTLVIWSAIMAIMGAAGPFIFKNFGDIISSAGSESMGIEYQMQATNEILEQHGLTLQEFTTSVAQRTQELAEAAGGIDPDQYGPAYAVGLISCIILMLGIVWTGSAIAQGVAEEKGSRIVEILLATLKPWQLMAGKILGHGIVGLSQILLITLATGISAMVNGFGNALGDLHIDITAAIIWCIAWFLVGYLSYACLFAAVGSTVSKPEEVQQAVGPLVMVIMIGYLASIFSATGFLGSLEGTPIMIFLHYCPLISAFTVPSGIASGQISGLEGGISIAVSILFIPLFIWIASRIYTRSILQTGSRVKLLSAFKR